MPLVDWHLPGLRWLIVSLALLLSGCYSPERTSCSTGCAIGGVCGDGFECRAGYCVEPGFESSCTDRFSIAPAETFEGLTCASIEVPITVAGGDGDYALSVDPADLPEGLSLDAQRGVLTGQVRRAGQYSIPIEARDGHKMRATRTFELQVTGCAPDVFEEGCGGADYKQNLVVPEGVELAITEIPSWLRVVTDEVGRPIALEGTPESLGDFEVGITALSSTSANQAATAEQKSLKVVIRDCPVPKDTRLKPACVGEFYEAEFQAEGYSDPTMYTWSVETRVGSNWEGKLPDGLELKQNRLTGRPLAVDDYRLKVRVALEEMANESELDLQVRDCALKPITLRGCVGRPLETVLPGAGASTTFSSNDPSWPPELELDGATGAVTGTLSSPVEEQLFFNREGDVTELGELDLTVVECQMPPDALPDACLGDSYKVIIGEGLELGGDPPSWLSIENGFLTGSPPSAGSVSVVLQPYGVPSVGVETEFTVRPTCVSIATERLENACVGVEREYPLAAKGLVGDAIWTVKSDTETPLPEGITIEGNTLKVGAGVSTGNYSLLLGVVDAESGLSAQKLLTTFKVQAMCITPTKLPEVCAGEEFSVKLEVSGAGDEFSWRFPENDPINRDYPWFRISADGYLSGVPGLPPDSVAKVTVQVVTAGNSTESSTLDLPVRACKFAFLGELDRPEQLFLGDIRAASDAEAPSVAELSSELTEAVQLFEFSPDGRWIAFATRDTGRLFVASVAPGSQPQEIDATEATDAGPAAAIVALAWNTDATQLAVVRSATDSPAQLYNVEFTLEEESESTPLATVVPAADGLDWLQGWGKGLFWLGESLCYFGSRGDDAPDWASLYCTDTSSGAFDGEWTKAINSVQPARLAGTEWELSSSGLSLFVPRAPGADRFLSYVVPKNPVAGGFSFSGQGGVDPTLTWVAGILQRTNPLHAMPLDESFTLITPETVLPPGTALVGCDRLKTWSGQGKYLACTGPGRLAVTKVELGQTGWHLREVVGEKEAEQRLPSTFVLGSELEDAWYAFAVPSGIRVVKLDDDTLTAVTPYTSDGETAALRALPRSGQMLHQKGSWLLWVDLSTRGSPIKVVGEDLMIPSVCGEDHDFDAGPGRAWCGNPHRDAMFMLSRDSSTVIFPQQSGGVKLAGLSPVVEGPTVSSARVSCGTMNCSEPVKVQ